MHEYALLVNLTMSLIVALMLGLITHRLGASPILGYILAGVVLGPQTPGFVGDPHMAAEFAEIGVILLMFGVGLHFHLGDLIRVKGIAIPGAAGQIALATLLTVLGSDLFGLSFGTGLVVGLSVSVASTVVLIRVLMDNGVIDTPHGHIAVGWLIVEDIFTVFALVLLPSLAGFLGGSAEGGENVLTAVGIATLKIGALVGVMLLLGAKGVPWLLNLVARSRSRELFVLTVLALALAIATGSYVFFGVSMALGAFLAGMAVGHSEVSHQAAADALPMRDAFAVLFFVSVGMLFDPSVVFERFGYLTFLLSVILLGKPLVAWLIIWFLGFSTRTALTVSIALAQVGEFSFILADLARRLGLCSGQDQSLLVTCALISITLNPFLFKAIGPFEHWLRGKSRLWNLINRRAEARGTALNDESAHLLEGRGTSEGSRAIVIGYGPVGQTLSRILESFGVQLTVIDLNLDTVRDLLANERAAIYGDASRREILEKADIHRATYLLVTVPDSTSQTATVMMARNLNPDIKIFVRTRYLRDRLWLSEVGVSDVASEEGEVAVGLASLLLREMGAADEEVRRELKSIREGFKWKPPEGSL